MPLWAVSAQRLSATSDQGNAGVLLHPCHSAVKLSSAGHPAYDSYLACRLRPPAQRPASWARPVGPSQSPPGDIMRVASGRALSTRMWLVLGAVMAVVIASGTAALAAGSEAATLPAASGGTSTTADAGIVLPVTSCGDLGTADLDRLDAHVTATAAVTHNDHPFCDVRGYLSPVTQFEVLLPLETWRGNYLQQGCGGFCGHLDLSLEDPPPGPAATRRPTPRSTTGRWWSPRTTRGIRRRPTPTPCGRGTTCSCAWCSATPPSTSSPRRPRPSCSCSTGRGLLTPTSAASPTADARLWT